MKTGTSGITVPNNVLINPPDEAIVTAVVVLKFATTISLPAEISSRPTGERIRATDRLVVIVDCGIIDCGVVIPDYLQPTRRDHLTY
jgi:hypothetical protein